MPQLLSMLLLALIIGLATGVVMLVRWLRDRHAPRHAPPSVPGGSSGRRDAGPLYPRVLDLDRQRRAGVEVPRRPGGLNMLATHSQATSTPSSSGTARRPGLARIERMPPLKRAVVWSDVLGRPVSERQSSPGWR